MPVGLAVVSLLLLLLTPTFIKGNNETNTTDSEWLYPEATHAGQLEWKDVYPQCGGSRQSPIDIEDVVPASYKTLRITGFEKNLSPANLTNNGHTVVLTVNENIGVSGGPMGLDKYKFIQLHFHWGSEDIFGSEHTLKNQTYAMEMHLVFFKTEYGDLTSSLSHPDGVVVLAVWFKEVDLDNPALAPVTDVVHQALDENSVTTVTQPFSLSDVFPLKYTNSYYHYNGSLTTPACDEVVKWVIFTSVVQIGRKQLQTFRQLREGEVHVIPLLSNHRPIQALNGRRVEIVGKNGGWSLRASLFSIGLSFFLVLANRSRPF